MGRIQSSVGLATGIPITDTVDQLIALSAKPRDQLKQRVAGLQQQQVAVGELTALSIAIQLSVKKLASSSVYREAQATSSNENLLAASVTGSPAPGTYVFTPVRGAQSHQLISSGVAALDQSLGGGSLKLRFGGFADRGIDLELLNSGAGVERGKIRITDRSGATALIDLRFALTIDDVLEKINANSEINVTAVSDGDAIRLVDETGQAVTNLRVQEVNGGSTATDLGLGGIDVAASQATGQDVLRIFRGLRVDELNDRNGLSIRDELPDLEVTFRDGSAPLQVDLTRGDIVTVGDLLDTLNAVDPARLRAELSSDGSRLVLTDLTAGTGGTFRIASAVGGTLAEDLGLTTNALGGVITGRRLLGGLKSPLLGSLNGGRGLGTLGQVALTDRSGASATVNLATAETLSDVLKLLNQSGLHIQASINEARNGILLEDTSGATAGNLVVANADATNTADKLGMAFNGAADRVNSGSLGLQVYHENLRLEALKNGNGIRLGSFTIVDSAGKTGAVNLRTSGANTVGDVMDLINGLDIAVEARINETGDGLLLVDQAGGSGKLSVQDAGTGKSAADLGIAGTAKTIDLNGTSTQVIDGSTTTTLTLAADDTLDDVVNKINELNLGVTASVFQSGSGMTPYRLVLSSGVAGSKGEMLLDASEVGLSFRELASAEDAILQAGSSDLPGAGILATSSNNRFSHVVEGLQLSVGGASDTPVTINVSTSDQSLVSSVKVLVDQYNKLRDKIDSLTYYDAKAETTGILFGSSEVLQVESRLSRLFTGRFFGVGSVRSLEQLGISADEEGKLELNETKLKDAFAADPEAVEQFFTDKDLGFAKKLDGVIESIAGVSNSLLITRNDILQRTIEAHNEKIDFFNQRLDRERERLLLYYYNMEIAISKIKANMSVVESLASIAVTPKS
jgi:flagellar hook-associated protein 2